jgi:hypothetical protein
MTTRRTISPANRPDGLGVFAASTATTRRPGSRSSLIGSLRTGAVGDAAGEVFGRQGEGRMVARFEGEGAGGEVNDWPAGRIGPVRCPIISPHVQIECKEMWPTWAPDSPRREQDAVHVALLPEALRSLQSQRW